ncbi:MAG: DNA repair protein RecN [Treponema sp.]|jgi:DNA repair protein RecN (Recombination protein N)|nr:DNA repair protein RecN [Treponema sp.]
MLEELTVKNYALIDALSLSFQGGLNILTGETGAGKSILVGCLSFLLGAKADAEVIRTGADEAAVSAVLAIRQEHREALAWLENRDIPLEEGRIIIRRHIKGSGRGSVFMQHVPVTRNDLAEFMALLFDIHGQHAHESLLRKEAHRRYLDRFAGLEGEAEEFNQIFLTLTEKKKALAGIINSERDRNNRLELLAYTVEEIAKADIRRGEIRELEAEAARLGDFEKLAGLVNAAAALLFEDEGSLVSLARRARNSLESAAAIDSSLAGLQKQLDDWYYAVEDIGRDIRAYRETLRSDPKRLEEVEERLAFLYRLKKKYGSGLPPSGGAAPGEDAAASFEDAILACRERAEQEIEALAGAVEGRESLKTEIGLLERDIISRAQSLSGKRSAGAEQLGGRISEIIASLGMPNARFSVAVKGKRQGSGGLLCGPWGADDVEFLISANIGEPVKELSRIASGGELSRVMLAIKTVLSDADAIETLIFDEVDTGVGGEVALSVGDYLTKIGGTKQIFCVTHLASIAVRADNHFKVEKHLVQDDGNQAERTVTSVSVLTGDARRQEIARMLAGDSGGSAALAHADALLTRYTRS